MKRYFTLIIILFTFTVMNAQQWEIVSEPYTQETIQEISFISENEGWSVGDAGCVLHTTDGGFTWEAQVSNTTKDLVKVFFLDQNNGWAGTGENNYGTTPGGVIIKTTDGGKNWTEIDFSSAVPNVSFTYCDKIIFVNNLTGFMVAGKSRSSYLLKTTDGGLTWVKKDSLIATSAMRWYDMDFFGENKGVVVGTAKNIQKYTTDGGETWNFSAAITDNFFKNLRAVTFINENEIITLGEGAELSGVPTPIYKSFDGGATWVKKTQSPINAYSRVRGVYFKNNLDGIAVGSSSSSFPFVYKTSDGGETWTVTQPNTAFAYLGLAGVGDVVYLLGYASAFLKTTDFGVNFNVIPLKTPSPIKKLQFVNGKGYGVQLYGSIVSSSDEQNENWEFISETGKYLPEAIHFLNENTGFVIKSNKTISKTTDGGKTWSNILESAEFSAKNDAVDLFFADASTGYAAFTLNENTEYHLFKTTDAGNTWNDIYSYDGTMGQLAFFDANSGIQGGSKNSVKITANGGTTWTAATLNNVPDDNKDEHINNLAILNDNSAILCGNYIVLKTTDKGSTWNYIPVPEMGVDTNFTALSFYGDTLGYMGDFHHGIIWKTTDGGNNWLKDVTFQNQFNIYCSAFNDKGELYFGTNRGLIVKWKSPSVGVEDNAAAVNSFKLEQNYPNPFNPSTTFSFNIAEQGKVTLKIYDVLGREAATVLDEELTSGSHNIRFNASGLSSGIYFYTLKSGKFSSTQKMVLMK